MTQQELDQINYATTAVVTGNLDDDQLNTLNLVALLGGDPRPTLCWPVAEPLFTTKDLNGKPLVHSETARMIAILTKERQDATA